MKHAVLYDADCNFCKVIMDAFMDWDRGRIRAVAIQSEEGRHLLRDVADDLHLKTFHVVEPDGSVLSGGPALTRLFDLMPGGTLPARILGRFPGPTDGLYMWIARNRITLSKPVPARLKRRATKRLADRLARER